MAFWQHLWNRAFHNLLGEPVRQEPRQCLRLTPLEDRLAPALTVTTGNPPANPNVFVLVIQADDAQDNIVITRGGDGNIKLNGIDLPTGALPADQIASIEIINSGGGDTIDLSGVTNAGFPAIRTPTDPASVKGPLTSFLNFGGILGSLSGDALGASLLISNSILILDGAKVRGTLTFDGSRDQFVLQFVSQQGGSTIHGSNMVETASPDFKVVSPIEQIIVSVEGSGGALVSGNDGADVIIIRSKADSNSAPINVLGGEGNDSIIVHNGATSPINAFGLGGDDLIAVVNQEDSPASIGLVGVKFDGGTGADSLVGGVGNDTLFGGFGNDTMNGQAGGDVLVGGEDDDSFDGDEGTDTIFGDGGKDAILGGPSPDIVVSGAGDDALGDIKVDIGFSPPPTHRDTVDPLTKGQTTSYVAQAFTAKTIDGADADFVTLPSFKNTFLDQSIVTGNNQQQILGEFVTHPITGDIFHVLAPDQLFQIPNIPDGTGVLPGTGTHRLEFLLEEDSTPDMDKSNNVVFIETTVKGPRQPAIGPPKRPKLISTVSDSLRGGSADDPLATSNAGGELLPNGVAKNGFIAFVTQSFDTFDALNGGISNSLSGGRHIGWDDPILVDEGPPTGPNFNSGDAESFNPHISDDGTIVAFESKARNLVAGQTDTFGSPDVFVRDMTTGTITLISHTLASATTTTGSSESLLLGLSGNGRYVLFATRSNNMLAGLTDTNNDFDVFRFDRQTNTLDLVSSATSGSTGNLGSGFIFGGFNGTISQDGRFVLFGSKATNLVTGVADTNTLADLFLRDMDAGTTTQITKSADGTTAMNASVPVFRAAMSDDGEKVVFSSNATNLTNLADTNGFDDLFLFTRSDDTNRFVTLRTDGTAPSSTTAANEFAFSKNGQFVAFTANTLSGQSTDLATNFTGQVTQPNLFVRDLQTGSTELVSLNTAGTAPANAGLFLPSISDDGRYTAFITTASNLVDDITYATTSGLRNDQAMVYDRESDVFTISTISIDPTITANNDTVIAQMAGDGSIVYVGTRATNLSTLIDDQNNAFDVIGISNHLGSGGSGTLVGDATTGITRFRLICNGAAVELQNADTGDVLSSIAATNLQSILITGTDKTRDELTIDLSNGAFAIPDGLFFDGKKGADRLNIVGGSFGDVRHQLSSVGAGFSTLDTLAVEFAGIETIDDQSTADTRTLEANGLRNDAIILSAAGQTTKALLQKTTFLLATPNQSLAIDGGDGNDTLTVKGLGSPFPAAVHLHGSAGNDRLNAAKAPVNVAVSLFDGTGNDTLTGHRGNTTFLLSNTGTDRISDPAGNDTLDFSQALSSVSLDLAQRRRQSTSLGKDKLTLGGIYEVLVGSLFADAFSFTPTATTFAVDGADGDDSLLVRNRGLMSTNDGTTITLPGFASVTHTNIERINLGQHLATTNTYIVLEDTPLIVPAAQGLLADDRNPDGDKQVLSIAVPPTHGILVTKNDGSFVYTPNLHFAGSDQFTYRVSDGGLSVDTVVEVLVLPTNDGPTLDVQAPLLAAVNDPVAFTFNSTDVESTTFEYRIDWDGNGTIDEVHFGPAATSVNHTFSNAGPTHVAIEVLDESGATSGFIRSFVSVGGTEGEGSVEKNGDALIVVGTNQNDSISLSSTPAGILVKLNKLPFGPFAGVTTLHVAGLEGNDSISLGNSNTPATLSGGNGNDTLTGSAAADVLLGSSGDDRLTTGNGTNQVNGDAGNDTITGGTGDDVLSGDIGNDQITGNNGNDILRGGEGSDALDGGTGNDILLGQTGNDVLLGKAGRDLLIGGFDFDSLSGGADDDICITGGSLFESDDVILNSLRAEWTTPKSYADRVSALRGPVGGLNGTAFLDENTIFDDFTSDTVFGGTGTDFFSNGLDDDADDTPTEALI